MPAAVLIEKTFAALVVLACVALLLRQFIGARRRLRIDAAFGRGWRRVRAAALRLYHWPAAHRRAQREAEAAIRRARGDARAPHDGDDDNVVRPKFGNSRKLH
jgi:hypothetical protein